jgi:Gpi18-like mannosyltransferase
MLLSHALLAWRARSPAFLTNGDDSRYFLLADSLRRLRYVNTWEVGQPLERDYPPVYPALLSLWSALRGDSYDWLLVLNIVASVASLLVLFVVLKRLWSPTVALLGLLAVFANPKLILVAGLVRPESLYLALSLSALALAAAPSPTGWQRLATGTAAIFATLARIPGIALLGALGFFWLQKRRFRAAVTFALSSTVLVGAWLYVSLMSPSLADSGTYGEDVMRGVHPGILDTVRDQWRRPACFCSTGAGRRRPTTCSPTAAFSFCGRGARGVSSCRSSL